jgi:thiol:disulfide interchange protein
MTSFRGWLVVLFCLSASWAGAGADAVRRDEYAVSLQVDRPSVAPGEAFRVAVVFEIGPEWHLYGNPKGPGTGKELGIFPQAPEGFRFDAPRYAPPKRYTSKVDPEWTWVYTGKAVVYLPVSVDPSLPGGEYPLRVEVDGLVCEDMGSCVAAQEALEVLVRVGETSAPDAGSASIFADYDKAKPASPAPSTSGGEGGPGRRASTIDVSFPPYQVRGEEALSGLGQALLFGFLAGLILNVMPCVLPVISIKIFSLVQQAGESRRRTFQLGLAFSAGILAVFLVLAGLAAIAGKSWGEQFASQPFLIGMIGVVFVFALGMFDLFLIRVPGAVGKLSVARREGWAGSFFKGMMATVLATPCSGPFLGGTLAWTLRQPSATIFLIYVMVGIGMAFPYVVLSAYPAFVRWVPKPGPWMERFKQFMGFVLLATAVYLLTILRSDLVVWTVGFCLFLGLAVWMFGQWAPAMQTPGGRAGMRVAALVVAVAGGWCSFGWLQPLFAGTGGTHHIAWEPFDAVRLSELHREGRTVMIDWTADWCLNCKFVEQAALETADVAAWLEKKRVVIMKADITVFPPPEVALMDRLGSKSVPFLAIFPGDDPRRPYVLRDIYSERSVLDILQRCP